MGNQVKERKCQEKECDGLIFSHSIALRKGMSPFGIEAIPCTICGRLHWKRDGKPANRDRDGAKGFFINGQLKFIQ